MQEKVKNLKKVITNKAKKNKSKKWEKPTLEDVSEKIMAQPYIRFT
ncbi:MAG: hypothetical protein Q8O13_01380 [Candidatus Omnitrophota bacterium]|nr:hypothetical protein [Candidatus Omnitrophota bacterium]